MAELIIRGLFILVTATVAALYAVRVFIDSASKLLIMILVAMAISVMVIVAEMLIPRRKKLAVVSGVFFGLIVGMLIAYGMSCVTAYVAMLFAMSAELIEGINVFIGVVCVFVAIILILGTRDDFRFIIPYVEFAKDVRGNRSMVLDTSVIIDGRIVDIAETNVVQGSVLIPKFVLNELQTISDSSDSIKRARGRRGLDIVSKLQNNVKLDVVIDESMVEGIGVDQKLVSLCLNMNGRLATTDFNLAKVARLRGVDVMNVNELANALRPIALPGEEMEVEIVKVGEGAGQGVGYLEDGTMVVVETTREKVGERVKLVVTSMLQTSAGRMIFGKPIKKE